jgi:hypothetical protein
MVAKAQPRGLEQVGFHAVQVNNEDMRLIAACYEQELPIGRKRKAVILSRCRPIQEITRPDRTHKPSLARD